MLFRFDCGHVGRVNESDSPRRKVSAFIRVAQIGTARVLDAFKPCPDCHRS